MTTGQDDCVIHDLKTEHFAAFAQIMVQCHKTADEHGWWDDEHVNVPEKIALMHSELSEALEEYRKGIPLQHIYWKPGTEIHKPEGFVVELADVIIRIMDLCGRFGLDLPNALYAKMAYNETREYRHGGKRA